VSGATEDTFVRGGGDEVDIVVVVEGAVDLTWTLNGPKDNANAFIDHLNRASVDYRMGVLIFHGGALDSETKGLFTVDGPLGNRSSLPRRRCPQRAFVSPRKRRVQGLG
jgi:16S rRNA U516 pseudouridylate synthase RsuA-like enzyme